MADLINRKVKSSEQILRRVRRPSPDKSHPLDDFDVIPGSLDGRPSRGDDPPLKLLFTPTGFPVEVTWPKLTIHKDRDVPQATTKDGMVIEAHTEPHLSMPHYLPGRAAITLHTLHFRSAMSVINGWRSVEDLGLLLDTITLDLEALKATFGTQVTKKVRERILSRETLINRGAEDLDSLEAAQEAVREKTQGFMSLDDLFGRSMIPSQVAQRNIEKTRKRKQA
jgi:hypothetical protein